MSVYLTSAVLVWVFVPRLIAANDYDNNDNEDEYGNGQMDYPKL